MQNEGLAILGDDPAFTEPLHVGRPNLGDKDLLMGRVDEMMERNWLTNNGPLVREFESELSEYLGVEHVVAMTNGTVALEIATRALDFDGEVIVPSFTFVATAHALSWQGITPVFADIDRETHTLDPQSVEAQITPRTTGIVPVHIWGSSCHIDELCEIANRNNLRIVYDAAHGLGCSYKGNRLGCHGDAEIFSFHATKFLNSCEGGAVATNDAEMAQRMRLMRNFGFEDIDKVIYHGTNGKMSELCAAMGLTSLESVEAFVSKNVSNYEAYRSVLSDIPGISLYPLDEAEERNYQYVVLEVDAENFGMTRDQLADILWAENVYARRYFYPGVHRMEPYRSLYPHAGLLLENTERLCEQVLVMPTGTSVSVEAIKGVGEIIRQAGSLEAVDIPQQRGPGTPVVI